jgi:dimethylaniline monooxygenase (N-oxide forming)
MAYNDVTVIGAGWSGIVATKYMLEEGLTVVALEKRDDLGGLWYYSDDPSIVTVMKSTRTTSSISILEMSDYPIPSEMGQFPHHQNILQYLHSYSEHFNVKKHIRYNSNVKEVTKGDDNLWRVLLTDNKVYTSKFLVVATGNSHADDPRDVLFPGFTGSIYHSMEVKGPIPSHSGCKLLIVGSGETAADVCIEWYNHASIIYWSAPTGQHFFRRYAKILPWKEPQALDKVSSKLLTTVAPYHKSKPGLAWVCKWTTNGSLLAYQGHGIPEWKNKTPFMHRVINKNGHVLDLIDYLKVTPKGAIKSCNGNAVTFVDDTSQAFDTIILCTGYYQPFPFLHEEHRPGTYRNLYKQVFDNEDTTLSFVGYIRPVIGSVVAMTETQARWVAKVYSGKLNLQSKSTRLEVTEKDAAFWEDYFKISHHRLDDLVEGYIYVHDIAKLAGIYPNRKLLFKQNPYHWYVSMVSPFNTALFRLNDTKERDKSIANLERHRKGTTTPLHLILILFLRITWFDWTLNQLEFIKYKIQTWERIRKMAIDQRFATSEVYQPDMVFT